MVEQQLHKATEEHYNFFYWTMKWELDLFLAWTYDASENVLR